MNYELAIRKFLIKVNEFYQEKDLQKFNANNKTIRFANGTCMGRWFVGNKNEIFESTDDICRKIQKQYKAYKKDKFNKKTKEFYEEQNLEKFSANNKTVKFANGTCMGRWFVRNKNEIFESTDDICRKIQKQYKKYIEKLYSEQKKSDFTNKIKELYKEKDLQKFNRNNKTIKFVNGTYMGNWFRDNKKQIFDSNETTCKKIQKQYKKYREKLYLKQKESDFTNKIKEFYQEKDLKKFNGNNKTLKFENGTCMSYWFVGNKNEIFESTDDICKKVQEQYKVYKKAKFNKKTKEFYEEQNLEKFDCNKKSIKFKSGSLMGVWFNNNKKEIFNFDDELCLQVLRQYYEYKNDSDMIDYIDDKLKNINKGNLLVKQE